MARYLLDTHTLLWWNEDNDKLGKRARKLLENEVNEIMISAAVVWEISIKSALRKLEIPYPPLQFIARIMNEYNFMPLHISLQHAAKVYDLPLIHNDPFDRLLIAQSKHESLPLLSNDPELAKYGVELIW